MSYYILYLTEVNRQQKRLKKNLKRKRDKFPLREPCDCRRGCRKLISQTRRIEIHSKYWSQGSKRQNVFLHKSVVKQIPKVCDEHPTLKTEVSGISQKSGRYNIFKCTFLCMTFHLRTI